MLTSRQNSPQRFSGTGTSTGQPQIHPLSIARMMSKHKLQIVLVWLVLSGIGVGIVYRLPPVYRAEAIVLVDSQKIPEKYVMPTVSAAIEDRVMTLTKEILAYDSLQTIIDKFGLYSEQRKSLSQEEVFDLMLKDTQVELEKGWTRDRPGAFRISYEGSNPQVVADVANEIASTFIRKNTLQREEHAKMTAEFLTGQLNDAKTALDQQEKLVSEYKLKHNGELPEQEGSLGGLLSRLQLQMQGNQDAIDRAQQQKIMLENSINSAESSLASLTLVAEQSAAAARQPRSDPATVPQKESEALQARLDVLRVRYSDDYPEVKRLRAEIAELRASESRADAAKDSKPAAQPGGAEPAAAKSEAPAAAKLSEEDADRVLKEKERLANLKSSLAVTNRELEFRNAEHQKILDNIRVYEARLEQLPVREQEMAKITRDYEISKENYKSLLDKKISADMAESMEDQQQAEKFTLVQAALAPQVPSKPVRPLWISVGCVVGLIVSLIIAAFREIRRGAFLGEWELPAGAVVLGRVPWIAIEEGAFDTGSDGGTGGWLHRNRRLALVFSLVITLACGIAAVFYQGWMKF